MYLVPALGIRIQISLLKVFDVKKLVSRLLYSIGCLVVHTPVLTRTLAYDRQTDTRP